MQLNNYTVVDRHNRPGVLQRVGLRTFFINDGSYADPYAISSVGVFRLSDNSSPSSILSQDNLVDESVASAVILMNFANSAVQTTDSCFSTSNYTPGNTASGIFKVGTGQYIVILDGQVDLSGSYNGSTIENTVSAIGDYIDVWTVKFVSSGPYEIFINQFTLHDDTLFTITEPLLLQTNNKLTNKYVNLGSKVDLKITTDIHVGNGKILNAIKNIFKDSVITNPSIEITKENQDFTLPSRVTVSAFADTSALVDTTSDNTMILSFDTNNLYTLPAVLNGTFGPLTGSYILRVKYNILNQTIISDHLYFVIK